MDGKRHDVWGDDPEERDADEVISEVSADVGVQRKWHHHPAIVPFKVLALFIGRNAKRVAVTTLGFAVLIAGLILVPLPGPGWLIVFGGLAILATEYVWARRLLNFSRRKVGQATNAVRSRSGSRREDAS